MIRRQRDASMFPEMCFMGAWRDSCRVEGTWTRGHLQRGGSASNRDTPFQTPRIFHGKRDRPLSVEGTSTRPVCLQPPSLDRDDRYRRRRYPRGTVFMLRVHHLEIVKRGIPALAAHSSAKSSRESMFLWNQDRINLSREVS